MIANLSNKLTAVRQISDLRLGVPILLGDQKNYALIVSIETLSMETFQKLIKYINSHNVEPYLAITKNRADFLNARVYDDSIARLKLPSPVSLNWIKSTADPAEDFEHPLKGPYFSLRDGNSEMAKLAIHFCKKAELLPAVLVLPIQSEDHKKLRRLGLLYQKISKNFESNKVDENLTLISTGRVPIPGGLNSKVSVFRDLNSLTEHYAIEIGILDLSQPVLTRLHSACFTGDILHSLKCDCGEQLTLTINKIQLEKKGIILYLNQEGRGIGLANKMRAYKLQDYGLDTFESNQRLGFDDDERDLSIGSRILKQLGIKKIKLLTNNPSKINAFKNSGIKVMKRVPLLSKETVENKSYIKQKKIRVVTFFDLIYSLGPNIAEPIRISVAPNFIASSKSLLIPIETL